MVRESNCGERGVRQNLKNWRGVTNIEERDEGILFEKRGKWGNEELRLF